MPSFPTNDSNGALQGKVGEWLNGRFPTKPELSAAVSKNAADRGAQLLSQWKASQGAGIAGLTFGTLRSRGAESDLAVNLGSATLPAATDTVVTAAPHGLKAGDRVRLVGGTLPSGLFAGNDYFVRTVVSTTEFQLESDAKIRLYWTTDGTTTLFKWPLLTEWAANRSGGALNPNMDFINGKAVQAGTTSPIRDWVQSDPTTLTYAPGTKQVPSVVMETVVKGSAFDLLLVNSAGQSTRLWVNGKMVRMFTAADYAAAGVSTSNGQARVTVNFPSNGEWVVGVEPTNSYIAGLERPESVTISKPDTINPGFTMIQGDSFTQGVGAGSSLAYPRVLQGLTGWRSVWASGLTGTGYLQDGPSSSLSDRWQNDVVAQKPDRLIIAHGINDTVHEPGSVASTAATVLDGIRAALPNTEIIVVGPWANRSPEFLGNWHVQLDPLLRAVVESRGIRYISPMQEMWITGNGHTGAPNGSGNADLYISSDGLHPSPAGHEYLAQRLAGHLATVSPKDISSALRDATSPVGKAAREVVKRSLDLEALPTKYTPKDTNRLNVRELGAKADGTDDSAAFTAAINQAHTGRIPHPLGLTVDRTGTKTIDIPAGQYTINQVKAMMGLEPQNEKISGLRFRGAGSTLTTIFFTPAEAGTLLFNDYWQNIGFEGISFRSQTPGSTFFQSYTTHAAQRYLFNDVSWTGQWKYVFDLQGNNNNCEFSFRNCQSLGMPDDGAFFYVGAANTSDQFVNYWFYNFKYWSTSAPLLDVSMGGTFQFYGLDISDWAVNATAPAPIFKLRGKTHAGGVQNLKVEGLRVEAKGANSALLYSEWGDGNVDIQCDWSSQTSWQTFGDIIHIKLDNVKGPIYNFHDSNLAGGVKVEYASDTWRQAPAIRFRDTHWQQRLTPSEVVSYVRPGTNAVDPKVDFIDCRGNGTEPYTAPGATIWDATVGYNAGPLVQSQKKRHVSVRAIAGNVAGASSLKVSLPVGALITGIRALGPAGAVAEADGGSWTVTTTEATPRVVGTVTVPGSRAAGYNVVTELAAPFHCSTREAASVAITATDITASTGQCMVIMEGYW